MICEYGKSKPVPGFPVDGVDGVDGVDTAKD